MKYLHNLIITGFLIPFLSLSAEKTSIEISEELANSIEETSLSSLDEELSLLDEEFEEFKEELISLENELQKEKSSAFITEATPSTNHAKDLELTHPQVGSSSAPQIPGLDPSKHISLENQTSIEQKEVASESIKKSDLEGLKSPLKEDQAIKTPIAKSIGTPSEQEKIALESTKTASVEDSKSSILHPSPLTKADNEPLHHQKSPLSAPALEKTLPVKELAIDHSRSSPMELSKTETGMDFKTTVETVQGLTVDSFNSFPSIENTDLSESLAAPRLTTSFSNSSSEKAKVERSPVMLDTQETYEELVETKEAAIAVDLKQAFAGSPVIYSILLAMSVFALAVWFYAISSLSASIRVPQSLLKNLQNKLNSNNFDEAISLCTERNNLFCKMISSGISSRRHGLPVMIEAMKAEGKRASTSFWQKIGLLNDIAIIAPMLGLLGTVLGMFYAFYDVNRSIESISALFDGLGVSVGTTVAGLVVAILSLILHSTAKYRLVRALAIVENEAQVVATLIDDRTSIYKA